MRNHQSAGLKETVASTVIYEARWKISTRLKRQIPYWKVGNLALGFINELTAMGWSVFKALLTLISVFAILDGEGGFPHPRYRRGRV